jgi:DNA-binding NarL/FixJ family response regulator
MRQPIDVMVVHPHALARTEICDVLEACEWVRVTAVAADGRQALKLARRLRPAVTLLDDRVPGPRGTDLVHGLARRSFVVVLTGTVEPQALIATLCRPVRGCLVYGQFRPHDLLDAVQAVAGGSAWLSPVAVAAVTLMLRRRS